MAQYYTPKPEELCIGFICECRNKKGKWKEECFTSKLLLKALDEDDFETYQSSYRVKCLDRVDIESCGFKYIENSNHRYTKEDKYGKKYYLYHIPDVSGYGVVSIDVGLPDFAHDKFRQIFRGLIKSKFELKRLLIQLSIK